MRPVSTLLTLPLFLICSFLLAQNQRKVDSLTTILNKTDTDDTTRIKALNDLGIQYAGSNPAIAKEYIGEALRISEGIQRPRGMAGAYNCLGIVYYYQREYDSALLNFNRALEINKEINHLWGQASAYNQIGVIHTFKAEYNEAIDSYQKAEAVFEEMHDTASVAAALDNIGLVYNKMGYYKKASDYYLRSISLNEKINNKSGIRLGYLKIAGVYFRKKEYPMTLAYYSKALDLFKEENNLINMAAASDAIGFTLIEQEKFDQALGYFENSLAYRKSLSNTKGSERSKNGIGRIYYETGDYKKALQILMEAAADSRTMGNRMEEIFILDYIAKCYLNLGSSTIANQYANESLQIASEIGSLEGSKAAYLTLSEIASQSGQTAKAFSLYQHYTQFKDSILNIEKERSESELLTIYETDLKEKEILTQKNQIQSLEQEAKIVTLQRTLLSTGLGLSFVILGIGFYAFRQKIKRSRLEREKLDRELEFKKKELTTHSLHLAKKNELLEDLKQKARDIMASEDNGNGYRQLINAIDHDLRSDTNWEHFSRYFEEVHKDFSATIKQRYPDITANEMRLLALLKMNLTSKEIANILNISQEGIKKARYRLRKKLGIASDESLQDLILGL